MKCLVVVAHPDDEVLAFGGTIRRLANEHHDVTIAILGEGLTSRLAARTDADPNELETLDSQAHEAAGILGAARLIRRNLPDNRFDSLPLLDVVKVVEEILDITTPEVVYTHHPGDLNVDHRVIFQAVATATRPIAEQCVRTVYAGEIASSTEWAFQRIEPLFKPNTFVDITETLGAKIDAMQAYTSESRTFPHPRSPEALRAIAGRWGSVVGCRAAEAMELIRQIV